MFSWMQVISHQFSPSVWPCFPMMTSSCDWHFGENSPNPFGSAINDSCLYISVHIRLFFSEVNPALEHSQIEELPVIMKLKESFKRGASSRDLG